MKKLAILICTILSGIILFSQGQTSKSQKFLNEYYSDQTKAKQPFIYSKGITEFEKKGIIAFLSKHDKMYRWSHNVNNQPRVVDSIMLTNDEKRAIIREIENQNDFPYWNSLFTTNALLIPEITPDSSRWRYVQANHTSRYSSFSLPVFFRNDQYCIFFTGYVCGNLCGQGHLSIYKKVNDKWFLWIKLYNWVA